MEFRYGDIWENAAGWQIMFVNFLPDGETIAGLVLKAPIVGSFGVWGSFVPEIDVISEGYTRKALREHWKRVIEKRNTW